MSPGRVECGPGMFSTAGATARSGVPGASRATVAMAEITVQAPVLSIFISSIWPDGLMLIPPESKQTPLPTMREVAAERVALAFPARAHDDHLRRVVAAAADGHEHAHAHLGRLVRADDVDRQAVALGDGARLVGEDGRADVVRGAVREGPGDLRRPRR